MVAVIALAIVVMVWCGTKTEEVVTAGDDNTLPAQPEVMTVQKWDSIKADYIGTSGSELFDTSIESVAQAYDAKNPEAAAIYNELRTYAPIEFTVWAWQMIPGFDAGVIGMKAWESKTLTLEPADAYGEYNEELVQVVPQTNFTDNGIEIVVGETYNFGFTQGKILEINEGTEEVTIDFNPKLAWKTLTFEVTVEEINRPEVAPTAAE